MVPHAHEDQARKGAVPVRRKAVAGLALACGLGVEILALDDMKVVWRWSNEESEHVSTIRDGAFRVGRTWFRLADFERYDRR